MHADTYPVVLVTLSFTIYAETKRLPKVELAVGALGGFLLGSVIKQR